MALFQSIETTSGSRSSAASVLTKLTSGSRENAGNMSEFRKVLIDKVRFPNVFNDINANLVVFQFKVMHLVSRGRLF